MVTLCAKRVRGENAARSGRTSTAATFTLILRCQVTHAPTLQICQDKNCKRLVFFFLSYSLIFISFILLITARSPGTTSGPAYDKQWNKSMSAKAAIQHISVKHYSVRKQSRLFTFFFTFFSLFSFRTRCCLSDQVRVTPHQSIFPLLLLGPRSFYNDYQ